MRSILLALGCLVLAGCVAPAAAVIGAGAQVTDVWRHWGDGREPITVRSRECEWARAIYPNDAAIEAMDRQALEDLSRHNELVKTDCQQPAMKNEKQ
jgi:hypothetical protein